MFTGNEDQSITLTEGHDLTARYRTANPNAVIGEYFGKKIITDILSQEGCVGIRMYYGISADGQPQTVITGVDANGNDLYQGLIGDRSYKSPPYSGIANPLNS